MLLRALNPDILAVQELISSGQDNDTGTMTKCEAAELALRTLADSLGFQCAADGVPAVGLSGTRHHTGLLWRKNINLIPGTMMRYHSDIYGISHGMIVAVFDVGGAKIRVGSAHLSPTDPGLSGGWKDAGLVHRAFHREDGIVGVVGGDWQGIGPDVAYDPNPYDGVPWHPAHAYHYDHNGRVDRHAGTRLERIFRFQDCARITNAPWYPTTGHHDTDRQPPRRIDRIYVTHDFPTVAINGFDVTDPVNVGQCTDHCPVLVDIDETAL